jgi:hypothetical protein
LLPGIKGDFYGIKIIGIARLLGGRHARKRGARAATGREQQDWQKHQKVLQHIAVSIAEDPLACKVGFPRLNDGPLSVSSNL